MKTYKEMTITIPPEYVLIKKEELLDLQKQIDQRVWISFRTLQELTSINRSKLTDILYRYREEIDVFEGGFVKFPDGGRWSFNKEFTLAWLKDNHARVWTEDK